MDTSRDYSTWFAKYFVGPIIGDVPVSEVRVLGGAVHAQVATGAEWRAHAETTEARVTEFEALFTARKAHLWEEITQSLAREREI